MNKTIAKFSSGIPKRVYSKVKTISEGGGASEKWKEWLKNSINYDRLERIYRDFGLKGVMSFTDLAKTCAYELIAHAKYRERKIKKSERANIMRQNRIAHAKRMRHLWDHYKWRPGMNASRVNGDFYSYPGDMQIGTLRMWANKCYFVGSLPKLSVRTYMIERGLKYWVTPVEVMLCSHVSDTASTLIIRAPRKFLVKKEKELAPDCMDMGG